MTAKQPAHLENGQHAEQSACHFLEKEGFKLVQKNYRTPYGEIDIIMQDQEALVFIEVRFRKSSKFGSPFETVGPQKQKKIRASAAHFLQRHQKLSNFPCRFDIVALTEDPKTGAIDWIQNAF
jgi:putative endonuclease